MSEKKEGFYKILLLGDSSVGKSCILMRYTDNTFQEVFLSTIGIDFKFKDVELDNGKKVKIQIWDTAGQDRFHSMTRTYFKGAQGIILVYDVTNRKTFENIKKWVSQIKEEVSDKVSIVLVGNKIDIVEGRRVNIEEGEKMAKECGISYFETSAKLGQNIDSTFKELVKMTVKSYGNINIKSSKLNFKKSKKSGCC